MNATQASIHSHINTSQFHFTRLLADTVVSDMIRHYLAYRSHKNVVHDHDIDIITVFILFSHQHNY